MDCGPTFILPRRLAIAAATSIDNAAASRATKKMEPSVLSERSNFFLK